jgi:hypothetical protein
MHNGVKDLKKVYFCLQISGQILGLDLNAQRGWTRTGAKLSKKAVTELKK